MPKAKTRRQTNKNSKGISLRTLWSILAVVLAIFVVALVTNNYTDKSTTSIPAPFFQPVWMDFNNQTYSIDGEKLDFMHGTFSSEDGGETAKIDNQSLSPSRSRGAAVIIQNSGGSGTFFYLVGGTLKSGKQITSDPVSLGDRIKIVGVKVEDPGEEDNGQITVTYLDRAPGSPMSADPTVQKIAKYSFEDNGNLIQILN